MTAVSAKTGTSIRTSKSLRSHSIKDEELQLRDFGLVFNDLETLIFHLQSPEPIVVLKALEQLVKDVRYFSAEITDEETIEKIILLVGRAESDIVATSLELLAELVKFPDVERVIIESTSLILTCIELYSLGGDYPIQQFSSYLLCKLTVSENFCEFLIHNTDMDFINDKLTSPDPDVEYNSLKIFWNLLMCSACVNVIINNRDFYMKNFLMLLQSEYPKIQLKTIEIMKWLTGEASSYKLKKFFLQSGGVPTVFEYLEKHKLYDIHAPLLELLRNIAGSLEGYQAIKSVGGIEKLQTYLHNPKLTVEVIDVLEQLFESSGARKLFLKKDIVYKLEEYLIEGNEKLVVSSAHCITKLLTLEEIDKDFSFIRIVLTLVSYAEDNSMTWDFRISILCALYNLLRTTHQAVDVFIEEDLIDFFQKYLIFDRDTAECPDEYFLTTVKIVRVCVMHFQFIDRVAAEDLFNCLFGCFKGKLNEIRQSAAMIATSALMEVLEYPEMEQKFLRANGAVIVAHAFYEALKSDTKLLDILGDLVITAAERNTTCRLAFIHFGLLDWLMRNQSLWLKKMKINKVVECFFKHDLSVKFGYTGRLETTDITPDGFYVCRDDLCKWRRFPVLSEILKEVTPTVRPTFVIDFSKGSYSEFVVRATLRRWTRLVKRKSSSESVKAARSSRLPSIFEQPRRHITSLLRYLLSDYPKDPFLPGYLVKLKRTLNMPTDLFGYSFSGDMNQVPAVDTFPHAFPVQSAKGRQQRQEELKTLYDFEGEVQLTRIKVLAELVASIMTKDSEHRLNMDLHLNEIKQKLNSNIIPLGYIKMGNKFERAVLFKVLADRIDLQCTLVRGDYGIAWNEVVVPKMEDSVESRPRMPKTHLKPNYVVDLVQSPGRLFVIGGAGANFYCGITNQ